MLINLCAFAFDIIHVETFSVFSSNFLIEKGITLDTYPKYVYRFSIYKQSHIHIHTYICIYIYIYIYIKHNVYVINA